MKSDKNSTSSLPRSQPTKPSPSTDSAMLTTSEREQLKQEKRTHGDFLKRKFQGLRLA